MLRKIKKRLKYFNHAPVNIFMWFKFESFSIDNNMLTKQFYENKCI